MQFPSNRGTPEAEPPVSHRANFGRNSANGETLKGSDLEKFRTNQVSVSTFRPCYGCRELIELEKNPLVLAQRYTLHKLQQTWKRSSRWMRQGNKTQVWGAQLQCGPTAEGGTYDASMTLKDC